MLDRSHLNRISRRLRSTRALGALGWVLFVSASPLKADILRTMPGSPENPDTAQAVGLSQEMSNATGNSNHLATVPPSASSTFNGSPLTRPDLGPTTPLCAGVGCTSNFPNSPLGQSAGQAPGISAGSGTTSPPSAQGATSPNGALAPNSH